jgi:hypothetical protein
LLARLRQDALLVQGQEAHLLVIAERCFASTRAHSASRSGVSASLRDYSLT